MHMAAEHYTQEVLAAFEGEIAGAAYFEALRAAFPQQAAFLDQCAALERATANRLAMLIAKYQLTPQSPQDLAARGALDASKDFGRDWLELMQWSVMSYAEYVSGFRELESLGPADDRPILAALTAHEVQLIDWMRAQLAPR
jgi:hypothetical protein